MTREEAIKIIADYDALVKHAVFAVSKQPFYVYKDSSGLIRLSVEANGRFLLNWHEEADSGLLSTRIENAVVPDIALLSSREAVNAMHLKAKAEEQARLKQDIEDRKVELKKEREKRERAEYKRLKKKFGG